MAGVYEPTGRTPPSLPVVVTPCGRPPCVARADLSCAPVARSPCVRNPRSNALADCCTGTRSSLHHYKHAAACTYPHASVSDETVAA